MNGIAFFLSISLYLLIAIFLLILTIAGFISICRAAACIVNEHERAYGKIKWKWLIFIDKNAEAYYEAETELYDLEEELKNHED